MTKKLEDTQRRRRTDLERIAREALAIEGEEALQAGALGYMARLLVQATMPHKDPGSSVNTFERSNGGFRLSMMAPPKIGLPWGKCPRVLLCWLTTEAVRTRSPHLDLGESLSAFMHELGHIPTVGRWPLPAATNSGCRKRFIRSRCSCRCRASIDGATIDTVFSP